MIRFFLFLFLLAILGTGLFFVLFWLFKNIIANNKASIKQWDQKRDDETSERNFNMKQDDRVRQSEANKRMRNREDEADEDIFEREYY